VNDPAFHRDATPQALGLARLREDPQYARIPSGRHAALVESALADGCEMADRVLERWGGDPAALAARCSLPVVRSDDDAGFGSVIVYAEYVARPPSITLYLPAIRRLEAMMAGRGAGIFGVDSAVPVFLAHELYHHFDCQRGNERLSRRHPVKIFGLGSWQWTSGLSSLCEIAAGAFAQQLLGLTFHPGLLDSLLLREKKR
jgi:hypothetical protein